MLACASLCVCRDKAPGQRECEDAIEVLNSCIRELDQASLAAISQQLTPRDDISMETLHEQMSASVHEISNLIDPVAVAAHSEASQLGHKVSGAASRTGGGGGPGPLSPALLLRCLRWLATSSRWSWPPSGPCPRS